MSGYTVAQLLRWSLDDKLIDSFSRDAQGDYAIEMKGETIHLPPEEARKLLIALLRGGGSTRDEDL